MSSIDGLVRGKFVVLEGPDFCGKTTQTDALVKHLDAMGIEFVRVREPGGTEMGETVRNILKTDKSLCDTAEMLLFAAARAQIIQTVIEPALAAGKWVIADRFLPSTIAMQYHARGYIKYHDEGICAGLPETASTIDLEELTQLSLSLTVDRDQAPLLPDLTIFLMPSDEILNARAAKRGGLDRLESDPEFVARVREGYRLLTCGERHCNNVTDGKNSYASIQYTRVKAVICQNHEEDEDAITQMVKRCISGLFYNDRRTPETERAA